MNCFGMTPYIVDSRTYMYMYARGDILRIAVVFAICHEFMDLSIAPRNFNEIENIRGISKVTWRQTAWILV